MFIGGDYDRAIGDNQWNRDDCWHLLLTSGARANNILLHITRKTDPQEKEPLGNFMVLNPISN